MKKYYWTMANGQQIDVDHMDITHLRNVLKMILRNVEAKRALIAQEASRKKHHIQLNGDMAQQFHETYFADQQDADDFFDDDEFDFMNKF
jgi:hypothetical protein